MNVRRILEMNVEEIASRGRQETLKILERLRSARAAVMPRGLLGNPSRARRRRRPSMVRIPARAIDPGASRFFEGASAPGVADIMHERFGSEVDRTLEAAEAILEGRFDLLGHRGLGFGRPIDWHLDPISGRRAPLRHWSLLDPLDPLLVGDVKVIWELNRHQWLVTLAQAWKVTGDERYAEVARRSIRDWTRMNPPGWGINWASSLEVSLRLIAWCWTLSLLNGSRTWDPDFRAAVVSEIGSHAAHVAKYLSHHFSPNTHLTGEALGLLYAGVLLHGRPQARRWRSLAERTLARQAELQILPDGVYFERSTWYERYTVETYLHFMLLARKNGMRIPALVADRLRRSLDFLLAIRSPDGRLPQIGDADGGFLLPLARRRADDVNGIFSTAAALLGRPDYAWAASEAAPETLWLMGPRGMKSFRWLRPSAPYTSPSRAFVDGGFAVMRSSWAESAHQLILDVGPIGCHLSAGHGHADLLSIQCSVFGQPFIVDPGTYTYTAEADWRDYFRQTAAHSTVVLDSVGQAWPTGPFSWQTRPAARLRFWSSNDRVDYADADHKAYGRHGSIHRRRVLFVKPSYWVVVDDLGGSGIHRVDLRFQFAAMPVEMEKDHWVRARGVQGRGLLLKVFCLARLEAAIREGSHHPREGWVSPEFGRRVPAPLLSYVAAAGFPLRIVTLMVPIADNEAPPPAVYPVVPDGRRIAGLVLGHGTDMVGIEDVTMTVRRG